MVKRRRARRFLGGALVSLMSALSKRNRYFPSKGRPTACPTMARNSPTVDVARWSWKALRSSSSTRFNLRLRSCFLMNRAHLLDQRLHNFCWSLRGAAAESNATNAVQDGGSTADPGSSQELRVREHESWLAPSEHGPSGSATPALEHAPALEHVSLRVRLLTAGALAMYSLVLTTAAIKSGRRGLWPTGTV